MHTCMRRRGALLLLLAAAAVGAAAQQCQAGPPCAFKVKGALCPDAQLVDAKVSAGLVTACARMRVQWVQRRVSSLKQSLHAPACSMEQGRRLQ